MTKTNDPTNKERSARYRENLKKKGFIPAVVVIPKSKYQKLKDFAKKLRDDYKKD